MNNKKKLEVKNGAVELNDEDLENTSGGYKIYWEPVPGKEGLHHYVLYDDNGRRVKREFFFLSDVEEYAKKNRKKGFKKGWET